MNLKNKYHNNRILNPSVYFEVFESDTVNFADFLALISREEGIVGFDMDDFKSIVSDCSTVYFRAHSGNQLKSMVDELCEVLPKGAKAFSVISAQHLPDGDEPEAEDFAQTEEQIKHAINPSYFYWNIYETEQQENYKLYVLVAD